MRETDIDGVADLAGEALAAGGRLIRDLHEGIASRPFGALGTMAAPVRVAHDAVAGAVYDGVGRALRAAGGHAVRLAGRATDPDAPALGTGAPAALAVGALNGMWGDHLAARDHALALGMSLRHAGAEVGTTREELAAAYPGASARVAVFVHGLCETEAAWRIAPRRRTGAERAVYGDRLRDELGFTPVFVRYNTGRHVSENGRGLAHALAALHASWPVEVEEIVLVGHSMGGLVARSACHYGERERLGFTGAVRHVFCLGTPHLGADLEKGANAVAHALARLPETRGLARVVNARSAGIKDLRYGACVEEDWSAHDPDEFLRDRCGEVPFLPHAHYYFVGARLGDGPLGSALGDLLVRVPSASGRGSGRGRSIPFPAEHGHELSGLTHFDLLAHPAVYARMHAWITGRSPAAGAQPLLSRV